jgi:hypothetical protein
VKRRQFLKTLLALPALPLKLNQEETAVEPADELAQEKIIRAMNNDPNWVSGGVSLRNAGEPKYAIWL